MSLFTWVALQVVGMRELNGTEHAITATKPDEFLIEDISECSAYESGGIARQKKLPVHCVFSSMKESLSEPKFDDNMHADFSKV